MVMSACTQAATFLQEVCHVLGIGTWLCQCTRDCPRFPAEAPHRDTSASHWRKPVSDLARKSPGCTPARLGTVDGVCCVVTPSRSKPWHTGNVRGYHHAERDEYGLETMPLIRFGAQPILTIR